ncbi:hypothetical protein WICMUC_004132 [Wickerhamomyces mucosus]|uniref:Uncharacterized protein n=1 Tax=Wickerhamomyces mucosus TaxID=1378264 RepID=A0A9P8TC03_9ASCO|nr:hypothetical protein WICMUC_004132 [Wickerhamomyces mucosus]
MFSTFTKIWNEVNEETKVNKRLNQSPVMTSGQGKRGIKEFHDYNSSLADKGINHGEKVNSYSSKQESRYSTTSQDELQVSKKKGIWDMFVNFKNSVSDEENKKQEIKQMKSYMNDMINSTDLTSTSTTRRRANAINKRANEFKKPLEYPNNNNNDNYYHYDNNNNNNKIRKLQPDSTESLDNINPVDDHNIDVPRKVRKLRHSINSQNKENKDEDINYQINTYINGNKSKPLYIYPRIKSTPSSKYPKIWNTKHFVLASSPDITTPISNNFESLRDIKPIDPQVVIDLQNEVEYLKNKIKILEKSANMVNHNISIDSQENEKDRKNAEDSYRDAEFDTSISPVKPNLSRYLNKQK